MNDAVCTVLVPTYRHSRMIREAVESVLAQTVIGHCRVIVSDDDSPDDTFDIGRKAADGHPNIEVRRNPDNLGPIAHHRHLLASVTTPYVAFLEGDDRWIAADKLERQLEFLERHPQAGMCFCGGELLDERTAKRSRFPRWDSGRYRNLDTVDLIYDNPAATFSTCLYRTGALDGVFDRVIQAGAYDWLCTLLISRKWQVGFVPGASVLYRLHAEGLWTGLKKPEQFEAIRSTLEVFRAAAPEVGAFIRDSIARSEAGLLK